MQLDLLRHAKSSWAEPGADDHSRPLNARGRSAATLLGRHLAARGALPERVLCSSAQRTRETWSRIAAELPRSAAIEVEVRDSLYLASPSALLAELRALPDSCERALLLGHNPGVALLAGALAGGGDAGDLAALRHKYPTGGLASLEWAGPWSALRNGAAHLSAFCRPKDLA